MCGGVCGQVSQSFTFTLQTELATRFELTGGFIRNALLSALSVAVSRDGDNPVITHADFVQGANFQLRGRLKMKVRMEISTVPTSPVQCTQLTIHFPTCPLSCVHCRTLIVALYQPVVWMRSLLMRSV